MDSTQQTIDYKTCGNGSNVLLLHGWGCNKDTMDVIYNALSADFRLMSIDFPGFGNSPAPSSAWDVTDYMEALATFLQEQNFYPCHVIAHSFGARVAILLGATHPEMVDKMVLTGAAGLIPKRKPSYYIKVYTYKAIKAVLRSIGINTDAFALGKGSADYKVLSSEMKAVFVKVINQDLRPYLSKIQAPVLLIWGEDDQETPLYFSNIMEQEIPNAGLTTYAGAGHYVFLDKPANFLAVVRYFLRGM